MEPNTAVSLGTSAIEWAKFALEALRLILSWPVIGGVLLVLFARAFKGEIRDFIAKVGKVSFPGGAIEKQPPSEPGGPKPPTLDEDKRIGETLEEAERGIGELADWVKRTVGELEPGDVVKRVKELREDEFAETRKTLISAREEVRKARNVARQWWLEYLRAFLRPKTSRALRWIAERPEGVNRAEFNTVWDVGIEMDSARDVLETLLREQLIFEDSEHMLTATAGGRAFLEYLRERAEKNREIFLRGWKGEDFIK
jgi:hypothetical protein